jgi:hypothetical protein
VNWLALTLGIVLLTSLTISSLIIERWLWRKHGRADYDHNILTWVRVALLLLSISLVTLGIYEKITVNHPESLQSPKIECIEDGCWAKYKISWYERLP